ncbi:MULTISPECIES: FAD:protein FMN transferase [unclassified Vibrio]|uniref:FAD:protein FMN transferase n=1 Tax=Vibrio sp. HB236076 TaxID=3232307 RepID=A0AB39HJ27_9VIBR|nr:FAD:protein FMN transferase [Vibrio sp. HB161653]MDP5254881.1 FAD:protein FMN transferase [Vibrio sp. HB161653]
MRYFITKRQTSALFTLLSVFLVACSEPVNTVKLQGPTMGTQYNITYLATADTPSSEQISAGVSERLEQVNQQMSTYRPDSELSQFNQSRSLTSFPVSAPVRTVVKEAIRLNHLTQGALDVTVGPLVNLWGFGPDAQPVTIPTDEQLSALKESVGIEWLSVTETGLQKKKPQLYVDLSTIAKGWGVDVLADYLSEQGIENYLVEVGGEIRTHGHNAAGQVWRIAIEKPTAEQRVIQTVIQAKDMAMATSGDYRNYHEVDGVRYSHIIDPATGKPIHHKVVSVTVLDKSSMTADGLATGLMVLGAEKGIDVAEQHQIPVLMIVKTPDGYKEMASAAFKPYLSQK